MSANDDKTCTMSLRSVLKDYIPHQLLRSVDESKSLGLKGLELVDFYIQNSHNELKMYGTAEQLKDNLEFYGNFPLNWKKYPSESMDIISFPPSNVKVSRKFQKYPPKLDKYYNLKGELMHCKQDCLLYFHYSIRKFFNFKNIPENLLEFMEQDEERLAKCYEFVKYDKEYFERIEKIFGNSEYSENPDNLVKAVEESIWDYHGYFYANFAALNTEKGVHAVVRIFENHKNQRFVMESELFIAINLRNRSRTLQSEDRNGYLRTIDMKEVYDTYRDEIDGIDFIRTKIKSAPRAAVPIATPSGDHCVLALDALNDTLRRLTSALKIFQKINRNTWHLVPKYVKLLEKYFPPEMEYQYFINLDLVKKLQLETDEFWKHFEDKPSKLIRDVGTNQFDMENVKKELKYLGLTDIFPEIVSAAKLVFPAVFIKEDVKKLGTPDMYSMIDTCIFRCIFRRFSSIMKIRHYQAVCGEKTKFEECESCNKHFQCGLRRSITSKYSEHVSKDVVECSEKPENVGESSESVEEIKKDSEQRKQVIPQEALSSENEKKESTFPNVENFRKTLTEVLNGSGFFEVFEKMSKKSNIEFKDLKEPLVDQFISGVKDGLKLRNSKIKETDTGAVNEQKKTLIEIIEKQDKDILALKESEKEAKKEVEHLVRMGELVLQTKDDEIIKLKEEISRMSKELKQAEKLKKNHSQMMKKKKTEIDSLISSISKSSEENKKLLAEISLQKTKEVQMKRSNEENIEKILSLQQNVVSLEKETATLRNDKILLETRQKHLESEVMEKDRLITELQNSTSQQVEEQTRINQQLQETISIMSTEFEEQEKIMSQMSEQYNDRGKTIKKLLARISSITDPKYSEDGPCPFRKQLMGLRKMKDNLEVRSPLKLAKDISQRLISLSTRSEIQEMAAYEYQQFEGKHQMLLQEVCGNIQKLKDSGDVMTFPPLPEYPSFSDQFVNEYWNEIEKQKASTSSESTDSGVLEDLECLICFVEMKKNEQTLQCDHCRKILHLECASKWLKIHRSCPHCRREQLDPNEFPVLR